MTAALRLFLVVMILALGPAVVPAPGPAAAADNNSGNDGAPDPLTVDLNVLLSGWFTARRMGNEQGALAFARLGYGRAIKERPHDDPIVLKLLFAYFQSSFHLRDFETAAKLGDQLIQLRVHHHGPRSRQVADARYFQAAMLVELKRYAETLENLQAAEDILNELAPAPDANLASIYCGSARYMIRMFRFTDGERLFDKCTTAYRAVEGEIGPNTLKAVEELAQARIDNGDTAAGLETIRGLIRTVETMKTLDFRKLQHLHTALADQLLTARQVKAAAPHVEKSLALATQHLIGPEDRRHVLATRFLAAKFDVASGNGRRAVTELTNILAEYRALDERDYNMEASVLASLGGLMRFEARFTEALEYFKQAHTVARKVNDGLNKQYPRLLHAMGEMYHSAGTPILAEEYYLRSIEWFEKLRSETHPYLVDPLADLGTLYVHQTQYAKALPLYARAVEIIRATYGPDNLELVGIYGQIADTQFILGQEAEAIKTVSKAINLARTHGATKDPNLAFQLVRYARFLIRRGKFDAADRALDEAIEAIRHLEESKPIASIRLVETMGDLYSEQRDYKKALKMYRLVHAELVDIYGADHPDAIEVESTISAVLRAMGDIPQAVSTGFTAAQRLNKRMDGVTMDTSAMGLQERKRLREVFVNHVINVHTMTTWYARDTLDEIRDAMKKFMDQAFIATQFAHSSSVNTTITAASLRAVFANDPRSKEFAEILHRHDTAVDERNRLNQMLIAAAGQSPAARDWGMEENARQRRRALDETIDGYAAQIERVLPDYWRLLAQRTSSVDDIVRLLGPREAMLVLLTARHQTFVWLVTADGAFLHRSDWSAQRMAEAVAKIRAGVTWPDDDDITKLPVFDTQVAYEIYREVLKPFEPYLKSTDQLYVVPDGALSNIPFHLLVTSPPNGPVRRAEDYRTVPWLINKLATVTLPGVSALSSLGQSAKLRPQRKSFLGVGNPSFSSNEKRPLEEIIAALAAGNRDARLEIIRMAAALPETETELRSLEESLGTDGSVLLLAAEASEAKLKSMDLTHFGTIAFATHAAVAGDFSAHSEAGLLLTPPEKATDRDDGYLTTREIAGLKLDADWVILSACDTGAGGLYDAEALAGLAQSFFMAGARRLLVSHWPVHSLTSAYLTTATFGLQKTGLTASAAQAMAAAMQSLLTDDKIAPEYHHPLFWAPFVIVGPATQAKPMSQAN